MPTVTKTYLPFRANRLRATRLDACGAPATGTKSKLVTDGLISVGELTEPFDWGKLIDQSLLDEDLRRPL